MDKVYQKVKDSSGPLGIDRVTLDGPRDRIGETHERIMSEPLYDTSYQPAQQMTQIESDIVNSSQNDAQNPFGNTDQLEGVKGLREHLEENYDYAKRVEGAIDGTRKRVAADILSLQSRL